ncbi:dihydrofolate reductase [Acidiferrobacter sp.]|uniref:dihydrofolate reductase n=1 Tax=Acidiferrobacter sp. TaxID=1872107 RepID=UPI002606DC27|nr:dihydrofolate reductase [Acidiferrobacter sp.]
MKLALLAAVARNGAIGRDNGLPWHLPDDLRRFRALTLGKTVIMGRKTYESLPGALPGRHSIVVSRDGRYRAVRQDAQVAGSLDEALAQARSTEVFIIGGASLYQQTLARADRLYLTEIDADVAGDAFFPRYDPADWETIADEAHRADDRHPHAFRFLTLERRTRPPENR